MQIYHYHPQTGIYLGQGQADESPLEPGVFLLPASSTEIAPPNPDQDTIPAWTGDEWILVPRPLDPDNGVAPPPEPLPEGEIPDWVSFYDGLLVSSVFAAARAAAASSLMINVAYTDCAASLGLARQGAANVPAIQASFSGILAMLTGDYALTEEQLAELDGLVTANHIPLELQ
ncbi:MAG: hypothetical protein ACO29V_03405 [Limnohabitans sp.]